MIEQKQHYHLVKTKHVSGGVDVSGAALLKKACSGCCFVQRSFEKFVGMFVRDMQDMAISVLF